VCVCVGGGGGGGSTLAAALYAISPPRPPLCPCRCTRASLRTSNTRRRTGGSAHSPLRCSDATPPPPPPHTHTRTPHPPRALQVPRRRIRTTCFGISDRVRNELIDCARTRRWGAGGSSCTHPPPPPQRAPPCPPYASPRSGAAQQRRRSARPPTSSPQCWSGPASAACALWAPEPLGDFRRAMVRLGLRPTPQPQQAQQPQADARAARVQPRQLRRPASSAGRRRAKRRRLGRAGVRRGSPSGGGGAPSRRARAPLRASFGGATPRRAEDESPHYVLPNRLLVRLASERPPRSRSSRRRATPVPPLLRAADGTGRAGHRCGAQTRRRRRRTAPRHPPSLGRSTRPGGAARALCPRVCGTRARQQRRRRRRQSRPQHPRRRSSSPHRPCRVPCSPPRRVADRPHGWTRRAPAVRCGRLPPHRRCAPRSSPLSRSLRMRGKGRRKGRGSTRGQGRRRPRAAPGPPSPSSTMTMMTRTQRRGPRAGLPAAAAGVWSTLGRESWYAFIGLPQPVLRAPAAGAAAAEAPPRLLRGPRPRVRPCALLPGCPGRGACAGARACSGGARPWRLPPRASRPPVAGAAAGGRGARRGAPAAAAAAARAGPAGPRPILSLAERFPRARPAVEQREQRVAAACCRCFRRLCPGGRGGRGCAAARCPVRLRGHACRHSGGARGSPGRRGEGADPAASASRERGGGSGSREAPDPYMLGSAAAELRAGGGHTAAH